MTRAHRFALCALAAVTLASGTVNAEGASPRPAVNQPINWQPLLPMEVAAVPRQTGASPGSAQFLVTLHHPAPPPVRPAVERRSLPPPIPSRAAVVVRRPLTTAVLPATAKGYALSLVGSAQFACLLPLWQRESGWNATDMNTSSGAYGIPQALPGTKMATAGADWRTNPLTQVRWGVGYIHGRYGTPCAAWAHEQAFGWY